MVKTGIEGDENIKWRLKFNKYNLMSCVLVEWNRKPDVAKGR